MPPDWVLSTQKDFPKADNTLPVEESLAILETAVIEILSSCDICQQGFWQATQCSDLSHRILVIALNQAYPVISLHKPFVEVAKRRTPRSKKESISPRWIDHYRKLWELDWHAANALIQKGLTPRKTYAAKERAFLHTHQLKADMVVRIVTARQSKVVGDHMIEGRLRFADQRSLLLAAITAKSLGEEMPVEITYEAQSFVAPSYTREALKQRLIHRGILFEEEVPLGTPAVPLGT